MCIVAKVGVLSLILAGLLCGQIPQGAVQGNVSDATGARIPDAEVALENEATRVVRTARTNANGLYSFNYLDSGTYQVTVKATGFQTGVYPGIQVPVGDTVRVDATLQVGEVTTSIEVEAAAALVQTDTAVTGSVVSSREVIDMPISGREFSQLGQILPGVRSVGTTGGALITQFATALAVGGTSHNKNNYTIDGVDNTFNVWNGPAMNPSLDSIQEFRIDRTQFAAEYGRGGAQLHLVTKSGTNEFHGTAYEYLRNFKLNAGNFVTHKQDSVKRNQFGANMGGPIVKNKVFFFFNWESQRERSSVQPQGTVFSDLLRNGNFSEYPTKPVDPLTGEPFPDDTIPQDRLNPVALAYMNSMMPQANRPGNNLNLVRPFTTTRDWDQYIGRVDYQLTPEDGLFFRMSHQPREGISGPLGATSINHNEEFTFTNLGAGWNRTWSPNLLTETRIGYHGESLLLISQPPDTLPTETIRGFGSKQPPPERLPTIFIANTSGFQMWGFPLGFQQDAFEFVQNATYYRGNHLIKAGFAGNNISLSKDRGPELQILEIFTGSYSGVGPADYLLGIPFSATESLTFTPRQQSYGSYSAFVQDDWKVTPSLTINFGLRYELNTLPAEKSNLWGNFSPDLEKQVLAGDGVVQAAVPEPFILESWGDRLVPASQAGLPNRTLVFGDHNNFAPRFGFAWRPFDNNKTVVRGGYGFFYILEDGNIAFNNTSTIPYGGSVAVTNTVPVPTFSMDDPFSAGVANLPNPGGQYRHPQMRTPYLQQISFGIQRELGWKIVGEANYQNQISKKLETSWNLNEPPRGPGAVNPRRPFQTFGTRISGTFHEGRSRYDALELVLRKRSAHYTFQWSHVWAKNLARLSPLDPYNRDAASYGPNGYAPHLNKLHFVLDLPFGKGMKWLDRGGVPGAVLGGWVVSGFAILHQGGDPLTVSWIGDTANVGRSGARPDRVGNGGVVDNPTPQRWIDPSGFVAPAPFTFGNSGQGILFGPSRQFFDFAVHKNFTIREDVKLQFRTEMFNAFNHPNLANPGTAANGLNFGQILTKTSVPRVIQFALRLNY